MAAAAFRSTHVGDLAPVSPELALVDAALAAELRLSLAAQEETVQLAPEPEALFIFGAAQAETVRVEADSYASEPEVEAYVVEHDTDESEENDTTSYPPLPAAPAEDLDATDLALREIRDRLTNGAPDKRLRLRRRFTVAAVVGTSAALAVLAVDLRLDLVQAVVRLSL